MSATATESGVYAPEGMRFVDWSNFNENHRKYVGETQPVPESDITDVDTQNATIIKYGEITDFDKRKKFKRLSEFNTGLRNGKWTNQDYNTHLLNEHLIWSFIGQLDLNLRYQQEVAGLFLSLNPGKFGVDIGIVAYCACAVVVHGKEGVNRNCHPSVKEMDSEFERVAECEGYQEKELISIYNKIAQAKEKYQG